MLQINIKDVYDHADTMQIFIKASLQVVNVSSVSG